jgi:hypothetical protein
MLAAFKDSDLLVEEVDLAEMLDPMAQMNILTRGMLPSNQSLDKVLSPATLALVQKATGDLGTAGGPLMRFKPWMLAITLQGMELMKAGFDPALGLDQHFYDQAKAGGIAVQGLETVEFQISRFDTMTMEQQDRMLAETLKELATETATVNKLGDAWKAGDVPAIERIALADLKSIPRCTSGCWSSGTRTGCRRSRRCSRKGARGRGRAHLVGPTAHRDAQGEGLHGRAALTSRSEKERAKGAEPPILTCVRISRSIRRQVARGREERSATTRISRWPPSRASADDGRPPSARGFCRQPRHRPSRSRTACGGRPRGSDTAPATASAGPPADDR